MGMRIFELFPELAVVHHKDDDCRFGHISYVSRNNNLGPMLQDAIAKNYGKYAFRYTEDMRCGMVDVRGLFENRDNPLCVEIGFGKGDSTFRDAKENPNVNFICFDVYLQGFAILMSKAADAGLNNILLCHYDALDFLNRSMPESCVDEFKILFPDPWPKTKHKKRRIVNPSTSGVFASRMRSGGIIHAATDVEDYAKCMLDALSSEKNLENLYPSFAPKGIRKNTTSYERKAVAEGREIFDIIFRKI
ncbi:MAG TPA: tRNA (guanosine(46)-N7)-methyltransferase TrmB [Spirochaetaceae bacterium]|nr:tRNA (guanosine(46)-N7)-methyltransferase TrmB [Spirochaetaceae bacterium]